MTIIREYVDRIAEEIQDAKHYAEKYVEYKARGNINWANRYKEMAGDELKHATYLHDMASQQIEELGKVFQPSEEMREKWERSHKEYVEKAAWVRVMMGM